MAGVLEGFSIEPRNRRGWPKSRDDLEFCLLIVKEALRPAQAWSKMTGKPIKKASNAVRLYRRLSPFIAYLQEKKNEVAERAFKADTERVLREVSAIGLQDVLSFYRSVMIRGQQHWIGKPPDALTDMQRIAVISFKQVRIITDDGPEIDYQYKLHKKQWAVEFLGRHFGMLSETLLIEMQARRAKQEKIDYSKVPTEQLMEKIQEFESMLEGMKDANAISGEVSNGSEAGG